MNGYDTFIANGGADKDWEAHLAQAYATYHIQAEARLRAGWQSGERVYGTTFLRWLDEAGVAITPGLRSALNDDRTSVSKTEAIGVNLKPHLKGLFAALTKAGLGS